MFHKLVIYDLKEEFYVQISEQFQEKDYTIFVNETVENVHMCGD